MNQTTLAIRVESIDTENLKICALALFGDEREGSGEALDAVLTELEFRMGDDFAEWADSNF